ncbi:unnamed protein product [Kuraishia capsulata CBS 1993]|uniref:Intimal thickness related receptor IRP domain-containing protein n=1 Tax=Kuraishia capsulata CBS 1993 TaxID=1382522 RepID=W6MSK1_9ASCO|nr:uncharacterized protein KUCA_T00004174001 [Kuraishia capsulata CBS 1993]CDK28192.1 unnamed protein product [Kuraishia capsulata CBS 1993]
MYNKEDWDGETKPFIGVDLKTFQLGEGNKYTPVSIVIYEYREMDALGVGVSDLPTQYICTEELVSKGLWETSDLYLFIVNKEVTQKTGILSTTLSSYGNNGSRYKIIKTGYYCVACASPQDWGRQANKFNVEVNFQNSFENLPASRIPRLNFNGFLAIGYVASLSLYLFNLYIHRSKLLTSHKLIAGFFVFLTVESIFTFSFYASSSEYENGKQFWKVVASFCQLFGHACLIAFPYLLAYPLAYLSVFCTTTLAYDQF